MKSKDFFYRAEAMSGYIVKPTHIQKSDQPKKPE